jgi:pimeloyl-ACP methyl ester carboxylesterase
LFASKGGSDRVARLNAMGAENSSPTPNGSSPAMPGESHFALLGDNRVHYVTIGQGNTAIVMVHGWAGNLGLWCHQVPILAGKAKLILIDLPGHGQSDKPQAAYTMDFFAEAVLAVLRDAKVDKAVFIAHSMGAAVVCRIFRRAPEKIAGVVSVDGLLRRPHGTVEQVTALVAPFGTPQYRDHAIKLIHSFFPVPGNEALRDHVMSEMLATPQHVMLGAMLGMFGPDQADWVLDKVNAPVAVINAPSLWWANGYEKYVRSLNPQTNYVLMDGVGHFLMLEKPVEFNNRLSAALQKFPSLK